MPRGQVKAQWSLNVVPVGTEVGQADMHGFPIANSFNCQEIVFSTTNYATEVEADPEVPEDVDSVIIAMQQINTSPLWVRVLQIVIPKESFTAGTVLELSEEDSDAFGASLLWVRPQSMLNQTIVEARLEAVLVGGRITIDEVAEFCGGTGCPMSSGTISLEFAMIRADLDPAAFN